MFEAFGQTRCASHEVMTVNDIFDDIEAVSSVATKVT